MDPFILTLSILRFDTDFNEFTTVIGVFDATVSVFGFHQVSVPTQSSRPANDSVTLVVDYTRFVVDRELFRAHPDTMLGR